MAIKLIGLKVLILPLSLALVVMISILFIKPAFEDMNTNRKAVAQNKEKLAALEAQTRKLDELKKTFESLEEKKIVEAALPAGKNAEDYLSELYQRASRSGVLVGSFTVAESSSSGASSYVCGALAAVPGASPDASSLAEGAPDENISGSDSASSAVSSLAASCAQGSTVQILAEGTWDQLLSFYKYLADSNRIANVSQISISPKSQAPVEGSGSDLLASQISLDVFYKPKSAASNAATVGTLAGGSGFNQGILKKLKEIVYAPYQEPAVSETGERNFFK
jgi:Tfp pilus assembly protein PilO